MRSTRYSKVGSNLDTNMADEEEWQSDIKSDVLLSHQQDSELISTSSSESLSSLEVNDLNYGTESNTFFQSPTDRARNDNTNNAEQRSVNQNNINNQNYLSATNEDLSDDNNELITSSASNASQYQNLSRQRVLGNIHDRERMKEMEIDRMKFKYKERKGGKNFQQQHHTIPHNTSLPSLSLNSSDMSLLPLTPQTSQTSQTDSGSGGNSTSSTPSFTSFSPVFTPPPTRLPPRLPITSSTGVSIIKSPPYVNLQSTPLGSKSNGFTQTNTYNNENKNDISIDIDSKNSLIYNNNNDIIIDDNETILDTSNMYPLQQESNADTNNLLRTDENGRDSRINTPVNRPTHSRTAHITNHLINPSLLHDTHRRYSISHSRPSSRRNSFVVVPSAAHTLTPLLTPAAISKEEYKQQHHNSDDKEKGNQTSSIEEEGANNVATAYWSIAPPALRRTQVIQPIEKSILLTTKQKALNTLTRLWSRSPLESSSFSSSSSSPTLSLERKNSPNSPLKSKDKKKIEPDDECDASSDMLEFNHSMPPILSALSIASDSEDVRSPSPSSAIRDDIIDSTTITDPTLTINQLSELARKTRQALTSLTHPFKSPMTTTLNHSASHPGPLTTIINIDGLDVEEAKVLFLKVLARALYTVGLPMHVVEFYLVLAGQRLGIVLTVVSVGTTVWMAFGTDTTCHMLVPTHPTMSLSKMVDLCVVSENIVLGTVTYEDALFDIDKVVMRKEQWHRYWFLPSMMLMSAACTPLFNGGWLELLVATIGGLIIGLMELYLTSNKSIARGHDLLSGLIGSVLSVLVHSYIRPINLLATCFGTIIWILPGLRVTLAMIDLSTANTVTGTSKFFGALLTLLNLGIGVTTGLELLQFTSDNTNLTTNISPFPYWSIPIFVLLAIPPCLILLDASPSHIPQLSLGFIVAYELSSQLTQYVGQAFGTLVAASACGIMSNLYGRFTPYPSIELYLFSIIMLVPGSIGVKSVLAQDAVTTIDLFGLMIIVSISIVTGMFTANVLVPPNRSM